MTVEIHDILFGCCSMYMKDAVMYGTHFIAGKWHTSFSYNPGWIRNIIV